MAAVHSVHADDAEMADPFDEVPRVSLPSLSAFYRILAEGEPVIITDAMDHWPAMQQWRTLADLLVRSLREEARSR